MVFATGDQMKRNPKKQSQPGRKDTPQNRMWAPEYEALRAVDSCLPAMLVEPLMAITN